MASNDHALNPLTPGAFCQKCVFRYIVVVLRLDLGQISFNLVENAFATRQLALLATRLAFLDVWAWACAEIKILNLDEKVIFFSFSFLLQPLLTLYWACFRLKTSKKAPSRRAICAMEQPGVVKGNFAVSFSLDFLSIFVHISGSIRPITLIWASLQRSFPPAEV